MFELIAVINIAVASFMIGNDYDNIVQYQQMQNHAADSYVTVEDDDGVTDLDS